MPRGIRAAARYAIPVVVALAGLGIRLWILGNAPINSDEATAGLMAHDILRGQTFAFFWGQQYGGVEPYVVAGVFAVVGQSPLALNATPALLCLVAALLVWRIGLRLFPAPAAVAAAVLTWVWSESAVWESTRESGYHEVDLVLGLVVLLVAVRIVQRLRGPRGDRLLDWALLDWVLLGAAGGVGVWASPEVAYFVLPSVIIVVWALRGLRPAAIVVRLGLAAVSAVLGALPWIVDTLRQGGLGLPASPYSYPSRLATFFTHVLPMACGLRIEGAGAWEISPFGGKAAYVAVGVVLICAAATLAVRRGEAVVLLVFLAIYPFLYAAFPTSWFWNDGRYVVSLDPVLALVILGALWEVAPAGAHGTGVARWTGVAYWTGCGLLVMALASTLVAFNAGYQALSHPDRLTTWAADSNPAISGLARRLEALGVRHVYAGYWVANDLTFISDNRVVAESDDRNPPQAAGVERSRIAGWIFVQPGQLGPAGAQLGSTTDIDPGSATEAGLSRSLTRLGISYRTVPIGFFDVVIPDRNVAPAQLGASLP